MGARNRHRKADKLRRRQRASAPRTEPGHGGAPSVRELICAAAGLVSQPSLYREVVVILAGGSPRVTMELEAMLAEAVQAARAANWEPAEIVRQVERRLGPRHASCVGQGRPRLSSAIDDLSCGIQVLSLLWSLPPLAKVGGSFRPRARSGDPRILEKVRALLAKAESTTFPEEAEALSAKAQELMARHSIDEAMVGGVDDGPAGVRVAIDDPYAGAKSVLLAVVASANRCRSVWSKHLAFSTVFGYESDLDFVEVLYTSLLVQATSAMVASGSQFDRAGRSRTRSFRQSFLLAYANRIGDRLREAREASSAEAAEKYGEALLPVLADRSAAVDAACDAAFPGAVSRSVSISNAAGWAAGSAAADLASLSGRTEFGATG